jgi:hypothetical protein
MWALVLGVSLISAGVFLVLGFFWGRKSLD